jgi:hypothetical protein
MVSPRELSSFDAADRKTSTLVEVKLGGGEVHR